MITRRSLASLFALPGLASRARADTVPPPFSTTVDPDGTTHITRTIPVPKTISPEAYALMTTGTGGMPKSGTKEAAEFIEKMLGVYPVDIEQSVIAGVPVKIMTPRHRPQQKQDRVLICVHGGGFTTDSGSTLEGIAVSALTGAKVVSVLYRLAPQFPFPAAVDDTVTVYKDLMRSYSVRKIGIYGTSAGAVLGAQTIVQLRKLGVPQPAVLGFFSGYVDLARYGDSRYIYSSSGLNNYTGLRGLGMLEYVGDHDRLDPVLSPIYADLKGFPPTLCMTSTRDHCLSGTTDFHRALLRSGVETRLMVFDALPHAFWYLYTLPESKEALEAQAAFLDQHLS